MADFYTTLDARARLHLVVNETGTSIPGNTSSVSAQLYLERTSGTGRYSNFTNNSWSLNIDGQVVGGSGTYDLRGAGSNLLLNNSFTVAHSADGTRTISASGSFSDPRGNVAAGTASGSLGLTRIPRGPKVEQSGAWQQTIAYAEVSGAWQTCLVYVEQSGAWVLAA